MNNEKKQNCEGLIYSLPRDGNYRGYVTCTSHTPDYAVYDMNMEIVDNKRITRNTATRRLREVTERNDCPRRGMREL